MVRQFHNAHNAPYFPKNIRHKQCYQSRKKLELIGALNFFGGKKFNLNCYVKGTNQKRTKPR